MSKQFCLSSMSHFIVNIRITASSHYSSVHRLLHLLRKPCKFPNESKTISLVHSKAFSIVNPSCVITPENITSNFNSHWVLPYCISHGTKTNIHRNNAAHKVVQMCAWHTLGNYLVAFPRYVLLIHAAPASLAGKKFSHTEVHYLFHFPPIT